MAVYSRNIMEAYEAVKSSLLKIPSFATISTDRVHIDWDKLDDRVGTDLMFDTDDDTTYFTLGNDSGTYVDRKYVLALVVKDDEEDSAVKYGTLRLEGTPDRCTITIQDKNGRLVGEELRVSAAGISVGRRRPMGWRL